MHAAYLAIAMHPGRDGECCETLNGLWCVAAILQSGNTILDGTLLLWPVGPYSFSYRLRFRFGFRYEEK
jgi:hypothetical protein